MICLALLPARFAVGAGEPAAEMSPDRTIRLAVRAHSGIAEATRKWTPTADALGAALPGYTFELVPIVGFDEMRIAVGEARVDFVLTNPAAYVELEEYFGVRRIATLRNLRVGGGMTEFSGVVFARSNSRNINNLDDVRGRSLMGVDPEAFGGWWMALRELKDLGIDPEKDCSELLFSPDKTQGAVVLAVVGGSVEIGTVRTGILEGLVERGDLKEGAVKILGNVDVGFPYAHSTRLYPEWAFAALKKTSDALGKDVAIALLSLPADDPAAIAAGYTGWATPLDYTTVHELMRELSVGPYTGHGRVTLGQALRQHQTTVIASAVFILVLALFAAVLVALNQRLRKARNELRRQHDHLEELVEQRTGELRSVFEAADSVAFITTDLGGKAAKVLAFSPGAEKIFGYSAEEIIGRKVALLHLPEAVEDFSALQQALKDGKQGFSGEVTLLRASGKQFPADFTLHPLRDKSGTLIATLGVTFDITERRQTETDLAESRNMFEAITSQSHEGVTVADTDGNYTYVNQTFCEMMGYAKDELLQMTVFDVKGKDQDKSSFARSQSTREGVPIQVVLKRKDGTEFTSEVLGKVVEFNDEKSVLGIVRDITERTSSEEALKESEELLVAAQKAARLGHYVLDIKSGRWHNSQELADIFGLDDDFERDVAGWLKIVHPDFRETVSTYLQEHVLTNHQKFDMEYKIIDLKTQRVKWVHGLGELKFDADHNAQEMFGVIQDITETKKLEEQLRQAQKMESIGRLAGGVAHDFNNMLSVILGHADLALDQVDPSQPLHADLAEIRATAERSADLTRQLLAFARKQTIAPRVLDLNDTVAGMLVMLRRIIGEDLDLSWLPGTDVWPVKIDPSQIDQILVNLCVNSRDAIESVGKVTIETRNTAFDAAYCTDHPGFVVGEYVRLAVSDNGRGMDKKTLSKLYEPFFTTKGLGLGTGLGLATVYGIVKQNNGFINVYSEPDLGTTLKVYLPREFATPQKVPQQLIDEPIQGGDETILLVEDEVAILELTTRILENQGYTVLGASTPSEAMHLAKTHTGKIPLLCTDVVMPEMSGLDLARKLAKLHPQLKCLFMSGYTANVITHHGVLDESVQFIQKPFTVRQLAAKVRETLDQQD